MRFQHIASTRRALLSVTATTVGQQIFSNVLSRPESILIRQDKKDLFFFSINVQSYNI